jgi:hypothetical protein
LLIVFIDRKQKIRMPLTINFMEVNNLYSSNKGYLSLRV